LLEVEDLTVQVRRGATKFLAVEGASFVVPVGGSFGIVGESGCGKSLTLRAVMALLPGAAEVVRGSVRLGGEELPVAGRQVRRSRRSRMAMVFQDPLSALNPVQTIGHQVAEVPLRVLGLSRRSARRRAVDLLGLVGIPDPASRADAYPHQLSGGMRQRVAIAIALAAEPELLLCDEPTTALDVTVQAQVLDLIDELRARLSLSVVFVSHDLGVVRELCEAVAVMYTGRIVETGPTSALLGGPSHPYTRGLLDAVADLDDPIGALRPIGGSLPDPLRLPTGCAFHPRCLLATAECEVSRPALAAARTAEGDLSVACWHADSAVVQWR
jgi:oligopeptide/dipeptide ABC transporter ATP-binding protein